MIRVLTAEEMRRADAATFDRAGIPSRAVMELAARGVVELLVREFPHSLTQGVTIVAGGGNNGGDGYSIGRLLSNLGVNVRLIAQTPISKLRGDALGAAEAWARTGHATANWSAEVKKYLTGNGVIVDALFGTGFHGAPDASATEIINEINRASAAGATVVSVDVPSGLDSTAGPTETPFVRPQATVTLQCPKLGQVVSADVPGELFVVDIGLAVNQPEIAGINRFFLTDRYLRSLLARYYSLSASAHKGTRGHVAAIGGGAGHFGAPKLAALGALSAGAGLATAVLPESGAREVEGTALEIMCAGLPEDRERNFGADAIAKVNDVLSGKAAIALGPGLANTAGNKKFAHAVLEWASSNKISLVLDAGALTILSEDKELFRHLSKTPCVLTPHPGELGRLLKKDTQAIQQERIASAKILAEQAGAIIVLKGARTVIATPEGEIWINPAATEFLGTAGSGDVLAGIIAGLMSRGMPLKEAALIGVFIHGAAGERLEIRAEAGATALNIAREIPSTFAQILSEKDRDLPATYRRLLPGIVAAV